MTYKYVKRSVFFKDQKSDWPGYSASCKLLILFNSSPIPKGTVLCFSIAEVRAAHSRSRDNVGPICSFTTCGLIFSAGDGLSVFSFNLTIV